MEQAEYQEPLDHLEYQEPLDHLEHLFLYQEQIIQLLNLQVQTQLVIAKSLMTALLLV